MSIERILVNKLDANQSWDVIGLDLAKHDLSCVGIATNGEISRIDRISYESFLEWASTIEPTVFAMEPCCEANYLCNQLESFGHSCRVISGKAVQQYIDVYFSGQKNDINDAEAIAFLGKNSRLKNIRTKNPDEMRLQTLMTTREHYIDEYRKTLTTLKGLAQFWGLKLAKSLSSEPKLIELIENASLPPDITILFKQLVKTYKELQKVANALTRQLMTLAKSDELCQKLMDIPGIGPICSTRLKVSIGPIDRFDSPRKLPAYFGLVPRNKTTGHSQKMGQITKRGDKMTRSYLVQAACSLMMLDAKGKFRDCQLRRWMHKKRGKLPYGKLVVALAAKLLRIVWAVLAKGERFDYRKAGVAKCSLPKPETKISQKAITGHSDT